MDYFSMLYTNMAIAETKRILKSRSKPKPTVLHRAICPCCGRKLVNVYFSNSQNEYMCKECLDKTLKRSDTK